MSCFKAALFYVLFFILLLKLASCSTSDLSTCVEHTVSECNEDSTKVNVSIRNVSKYEFCNVVLNPSGEVSNYGIILRNETSCYRSFDLAYRYAQLKLMIGNEFYYFQPIDYVGEEPLSVGNHTYLVDIEDGEFRQLTITLDR